ncbi:hypothetical protein KGF56_002099 [Candida oxycetoniae]|uniref:Amino acid permease/ SLC12A domain-containing protein n=1 Tax=Candida oxycetoniae TaxID=497107 RepID=A0AAI9SYJ5_9ASCO|nr:uncharacterized protein KGF56_002099 [Candida oxycetoniae]KAI3405143.2 hypothetical protein KGF56_002099 [Candida oxycetoniae]
MLKQESKEDHQISFTSESFQNELFDYSHQDIEESNEIFYHENRLSSSLNARLIGMISLVGVFGTGIFLSSGGTLATAGPVGMILAYVLVGTVVAANQICMVETSCFYPATSSYVAQSEQFIDKSLGFVFGICSTYNSLIPGELTATTVIMTYWTDINPAVFITIFGLFIVATNIYKVRWYGEIEFFFGILKLLLCAGLILVGLVIDLGGAPNQKRLGFHYWKTPGPFAEKYASGSLGKFLGFWKAVSSVVYAFGGLQNITMLAGETEYPRRAIYRAGKRIMTRVLSIYIIMVFILSMIVPSNDKIIAHPNGTASGSPWVRAVNLAGIKVLPHIINAVVLTSALSAANLGIIKSSRNIFALAIKKQLPSIFLKVNRHGLPYVAVAFSCAFLPLGYMTVNKSAATVFSWFQNIGSSDLLLTWIAIAINHIAMSRAMKAQGYSRKDLPYTFPIGKYCGYYSLFFSILFLLTGGFPAFIHGYWNFATLFSAYFVIPLSLGLFIFAKLFFKTKYIKPSEVRLKPLFFDVQNRPEPPYEKLHGWQWLSLLWG